MQKKKLRKLKSCRKIVKFILGCVTAAVLLARRLPTLSAHWVVFFTAELDFLSPQSQAKTTTIYIYMILLTLFTTTLLFTVFVSIV